MADKRMDRRSFLRQSTVGGGALAAGSLAAPAVLAQSPLVVKMQTSWPASDIWMDFARQYITRVEEMSNGRVTVDLLPAGAVVGAFQVMDAVNDGVIDAIHESEPVGTVQQARKAAAEWALANPDEVTG